MNEKSYNRYFQWGRGGGELSWPLINPALTAYKFQQMIPIFGQSDVVLQKIPTITNQGDDILLFGPINLGCLVLNEANPVSPSATQSFSGISHVYPCACLVSEVTKARQGPLRSVTFYIEK